MTKYVHINGTKIADVLNYAGSALNLSIKGKDGNDVIISGSGNDKLSGGKGNDFISGGAGNDKIKGNDGSDLIIGGAGNDDIDGGKSTDTAVYQGNYQEYSFSFKQNGDLKGTVTDLVANRDGSDTLKNVEFIQFNNALYDVANDTVYVLNQAAVIGNPTVADVTEDVSIQAGQLVAAGTISVSDADPGESSFQTTVTPSAGNLGTLTLQANGSYTYAVANSAVQFLGASDSKVDSFTVKSFDGTSKLVSFTIHGTNDAAVIGTPTVSNVTEDVAVNGSGNLTVAGTISVSDADQNQSSFQTTVTAAAGNLGTLVLAANGGYTYTVANFAVQYLGASDSKVDSFTIKSFDGTTQLVSFTIHGTNDAAVIGTPTVADVTEDAAVNGSGNLTASGTISVSDADTGQSSFQATVTGAAGNLGSLALAANGSYTYTVANFAVQYLGASDSKVDSFTIKSFDGTTQLVSFTIHGTSDAAVLSADVRTLTETNSATDISTSGTLTISDVDSPATFVAQAGTVGSYGTFSINSAGAWTYTASSAHNEFQDGITYTDTFSVLSADGTATSVTINILGTNDAAVLSSDSRNLAETNSATDISANGTLTVSDVDSPATFVAQSGTVGSYGTFSINSAGAWTYTASSAHDEFASGVTYTDTFAVASADGTATSVTINILGTNDAPVITSAAQSGSATEIADLAVGENATTHTASGAVTFADVDALDTHSAGFVAQAGGYLGSFTLGAVNQAGDSVGWTFSVADSDLDSLAAGQVLTQRYDVTVDDGHPGGTAMQTVTITITGTNDIPVIGGASTATVQEDVGAVGGSLSASGDLTIADADAGQSVFQAQAGTAGSNGYGTFTLGANGHWTYTASNAQAAVQGLAVDEHLTDSFTAVSSDGTANRLVTVTINGSNDVTYIADGSVNPAATKLGAGTQLITGTGIPANHFGLAEQTDVGVELGLQVIYRQGPTVTTADTYSDGVLHFTVNDGPQSTLNGSSANNLTRAAWSFDYSIATGLNPGEPNNLDGFTFKMLVDVDPTAAINYRTLTLEPGGSGSSAHQWRDQGSNLVVIPDDAGNANVTQNSQNYAFYSAFLTSPYGTTNNFDGPAQFDLVLEAYRSGSLLANNHVVVDVVESNHAPVAVADSNGGDAVVEAGVNPGNTPFPGDNSAAGNVLTNDTDVDLGDTKTVSAVNGSAANVGTAITGTYGKLTLGANGAWSYTLLNGDPDTNGLAQGQHATDVFTYTVRDTDGATSSTTLTVNITGTNDAPVAVPDVNTGAPVVESGVNPDNTPFAGNDFAHGNATANDFDVDIGDTRHVSAVNGQPLTVGAGVAGTYGTLTFVDNISSWTYTLDNADPDTDALAQGQSASDVFTYTYIDSQGATSTSTITIGITGTNDAPVVAAPPAGSTNEDQSVAVTGMSVSDADSANLTVTLTAASTLTLASTAGLAFTAGDGTADETMTFSGSQASINAAIGSMTYAPTPNASGERGFSYSVTDGLATTNGSVTIDVAPDADAPTLTIGTPGGGGTVTDPTPMRIGANDHQYDMHNLYADLSNGPLSFARGDLTVTTIPPISESARFTVTSATQTYVVSGQDFTYGPGNVPNGGTIAGLDIIGPDVEWHALTITNAGSLPSHDDYWNIPATQFISAISAYASSGGSNTAGLDAIFKTDTIWGIVGVDNGHAAESHHDILVGGDLDDVLAGADGDDALYGGAGNDLLIGGGNFADIDYGGTGADRFQFGNGGGIVADFSGHKPGGDNDIIDISAVIAPVTTFAQVMAGTTQLGNDVQINVSGVHLTLQNYQKTDLVADDFLLFGQNYTQPPATPGHTSGGGSGNTATGNEDTPIALPAIAASLNDTDGSETLSVAIGGIPSDATLSDGMGHSFSATPGNTTANVTGWNLSALSIMPPPNFNGTITLNVEATATDTATLSSGPAVDTATTLGTIQVTVNPVNDNQAPETNATSGSGTTNSAIPVLLSGSDVDGTVASFTITSPPFNGTLYSDPGATLPILPGGSVNAVGNSATVYVKSSIAGDASFQYASVDNNGATDATPAFAAVTITNGGGGGGGGGGNDGQASLSVSSMGLYNYAIISDGSAGLDLNNAGQLVGQYTDSTPNQWPHGFVYDKHTGTFTTVDPNPAGIGDQLRAFNDSGVVVGSYQDSPSQPFHSHVFIYHDGVYTIDPGVPLVEYSFVGNLGDIFASNVGPTTAIMGNNNNGLIAGNYVVEPDGLDDDSNEPFVPANEYQTAYAFIYDPVSNAYITLDVPGALHPTVDGNGQVHDNGSGTFITMSQFSLLGSPINDLGQVWGHYSTSSMPGGLTYFLYDPANHSDPVQGGAGTGTYTTIHDPNDVNNNSTVLSLNNAGQLIGSYVVNGNQSGFLYDSTTHQYTEINLGPGGTVLYGLNDNGQVVGQYGSHGFIFDSATSTTTTIDFPDATNTTITGINNDGFAIGQSFNQFTSVGHHFSYDLGTGHFALLDDPAAGISGLTLRTINDEGTPWGVFSQGNGPAVFLADPAAPPAPGTVVEHQLLFANLGTDPDGGPSPNSFSFQWYRDSNPISGENHQTYTVTAADIGHQIKASAD